MSDMRRVDLLRVRELLDDVYRALNAAEASTYQNDYRVVTEEAKRTLSRATHALNQFVSGFHTF